MDENRKKLLSIIGVIIFGYIGTQKKEDPIILPVPSPPLPKPPEPKPEPKKPCPGPGPCPLPLDSTPYNPNGRPYPG